VTATVAGLFRSPSRSPRPDSQMQAAIAQSPGPTLRVPRVALVMLGVTVAAAVLAGRAPIQVSIWTVFLFAGPHNWMEARYFLARMPVRWEGSRAFFTIAAFGVLLLSIGWVALPAGATGRALWHTGLVLWLLALLDLHHRRQPLASAAWPIGLAVLAGAWFAPGIADIALVYAHPLMALWFLDIQIRRSRPEWRPAYRACLASLPLILMLLWQFAARPPVTQDLAAAITLQAGSPLLISTHVFLETMHYSVWLVALPLLGLSEAPWRWGNIPLIRHRDGWPRLIRAVLLSGAAGVALLWVLLALDYATVRRAYFTIAITHVLAEAPFLIRMLK
jgi:hypothetical protein